MKFSKILGAALIVIGIGLLGYWADCNCWHPTHEVLQMRAKQAEYGTITTLLPDPTKIYLLGGFVALCAGIHCLNK